MPVSPLRLMGALLIGVFSLGFSALFVRWAAAPGVVSNFYRMAIAAVLLAPLFIQRARRGGGLGVRPAAFAALAGLFFAADIGLWATGVVLRGATIPTLMANTAPLWVGMGALLFYRQRLGWGFWLGLLLALLGAWWVLGADLRLEGAASLGSLLGLAAGLFYGAYYLIMQRARRDLDPLAGFWVAAVVSALGLFAAVRALGLPLTGYPPRSYLNFLGLALVTQVLGYLSITYALGHLPASLVAPVMLGQPVVTALLAWPLLGEALSLGQMVGGAAVLLGVYSVQRAHTRAGLQEG